MVSVDASDYEGASRILDLVATGPVFATAPRQSDYVSAWNGGTGAGRAARSGLHPVERCVPDAVARALKSLSHLAQATVLPFDRRSFRRVDISNLKPRKRA